MSKKTCLFIDQRYFTTRFIWVTFISLTVSTLWIQRENMSDHINPEYAIEKELVIDKKYSEQLDFFSEDIKYILLWRPDNYGTFSDTQKGYQVFIKGKCSVKNCFVTSDKNYFDGDLSRFHAIAFSGINLKGLKSSNLPNKRWTHQKYIYYNLESADLYPVCHQRFDDFFNWTVTYRLDSDIPNPYILIKDSKGLVVGPQKDIDWVTNTVQINDAILKKIKHRTKAAAWLVSNCLSKTKRKYIYKRLQKALDRYRLKVDVYGRCGTLKCPKQIHSKCVKLVERDYFFYLAWENSLDKDYVTEKLLTAVQHHVVPIVLGGANYSRFLPPGSYLHALGQPFTTLAKNMYNLIQSPDQYQKYLQWTSHYTYHDPANYENVCAVCEALNSDKYDQLSTYKDFRTWWNPQYKLHCPDLFTKLNNTFMKQ